MFASGFAVKRKESVARNEAVQKFPEKIELLRLVGWPAGFSFQMVGKSISPDVKEPEL
jgi:hypothetical protein